MIGGGRTGPRLSWPAAARAAFVLLAATSLAACTTVPVLDRVAAGEAISGRLALRVEASEKEPARAFAAAFDLRGSSRTGVLALSTPLGSTLAQARWQPAEVVLVTPNGIRTFASLDELTRNLLGESVPVEAWFDWLRGRPWPGAPSAPAPADVASGFVQQGWTVDLAGFADGSVSATRAQPAPVVTVRIRLDGH